MQVSISVIFEKHLMDWQMDKASCRDAWTHFYNWIFIPLSGNLLGQNKIPNQILANYIEIQILHSTASPNLEILDAHYDVNILKTKLTSLSNSNERGATNDISPCRPYVMTLHSLATNEGSYWLLEG